MTDELIRNLRHPKMNSAQTMTVAAEEIETLRALADYLDERDTKLRELIAIWVAARDKWNKAMWTEDLTTEQRSVIERELVRSINLLTVEAARQPRPTSRIRN